MERSIPALSVHSRARSEDDACTPDAAAAIAPIDGPHAGNLRGIVMKAIRLSSFGSADQLQLQEIPMPAVGPQDVLVRVVAAGVNPVDWKIRSGAMAGLFPVSVLGELVSMGTLLAFATVCIGVLILRYTRPELKRSFRVPFVWPICIIGALACVYLFWQAFEEHWRLMCGWIVIGQVIYFGYGYAHSKLRKSLA